MSNRRFTQFYQTLHKNVVQLDCSFTVDSTNANGITNLKGAGIQAVYMKTSITPSAGNPNPANGMIIVQFQDNYNGLYVSNSGIQSPVTGANINISSAAVLTIGNVYQITSVGTSTSANWQAAGLPLGILPAVGVPFVAKITGSGTGTGQVKAIGKSNITCFEQIGDASKTLTSAAGALNIMGSSSSSYLIYQALAATNGTTTTLIPTAPVDQSIISMDFVLNNSMILVKGS